MTDASEKSAVTREYLIFAIAACGIISGMLSPIMIALARPLAEIFAAALLVFALKGLVVLFSTFFAALLTVMIGGIPAAIFERVTGRNQSDERSLVVWLAGTAILALPAIVNIVRLVSG